MPSNGNWKQQRIQCFGLNTTNNNLVTWINNIVTCIFNILQKRHTFLVNLLKGASKRSSFFMFVWMSWIGGKSRILPTLQEEAGFWRTFAFYSISDDPFWMESCVQKSILLHASPQRTRIRPTRFPPVITLLDPWSALVFSQLARCKTCSKE